MDTSVSNDNWGAQHHRISRSGYFDYGSAFRMYNGVNIANKEM